jgi:Right handed beta helix region
VGSLGTFFKTFLILSALILASLFWNVEVQSASIYLTWTATSDNEDNFKIERLVAGVVGAILSVPGNVTSYVDTGLVSGSTYCYRFVASNATENSEPSSEACAIAEDSIDPSAEGSASFTFTGSGMATGIIHYADNLLSSNCTSGNYSIANRNCSGSAGNAYRTVEAAATGLGAGDIVNIRESGTVYTGSGGESSILLSQMGTGTSSNHLIIQKYPRDSGTVYLQEVGGGGSPTSPKNVTVRNVTINCGNFTVPNGEINGSVGIWNVHGVKFENVVVENCWHVGIQAVGQSEFINMTVRFNGFGVQGDPVSPAGGYGVYTGGPAVPVGAFDNNIFDGGRYHDNAAYGIHCYADCGDTIIRNLRIDHNGTVGVIMAYKAGSQISNVVADNNGSTGIWLAADGLVGENLTAYNNGAADIMVSSYSNIIVRDSIALNGIGEWDGLGYTSSNNITSGSASTYFVDATNGNFQLTPTSTALGVGADVSGL